MPLDFTLPGHNLVNPGDDDNMRQVARQGDDSYDRTYLTPGMGYINEVTPGDVGPHSLNLATGARWEFESLGLGEESVFFQVRPRPDWSMGVLRCTMVYSSCDHSVSAQAADTVNAFSLVRVSVNGFRSDGTSVGDIHTPFVDIPSTTKDVPASYIWEPEVWTDAMPFPDLQHISVRLQRQGGGKNTGPLAVYSLALEYVGSLDKRWLAQTPP